MRFIRKTHLPILLSELDCEIFSLPLQIIMLISTTTDIECLLDSLLSVIMLCLFLVTTHSAALAKGETALGGHRCLGDLLLLSKLLAFHQS